MLIIKEVREVLNLIESLEIEGLRVWQVRKLVEKKLNDLAEIEMSMITEYGGTIVGQTSVTTT